MIIIICLFFVSSAKSDVVVLCYHRIIPNSKSTYDVSVSEFEKQIKTLIDSGYKIIKISDLLEGIDKKNIPEKGCIITIDDGDMSNYEYVYPIIKKYKVPITLFIYTDYISRGKRALSWKKLEGLSKDKLIEIGSHTRTHPYLTRLKIQNSKSKVQSSKDKNSNELDIKKIEKEIRESKEILEEKLKIKIKYFAYPYGLYNRQVEDVVIKSGYETALTLDWGNNDSDTNKFRIKRKLVVATYNIKKLMAVVKSTK